ncbi:MAG: DUF4338 domain-containing protein [Bacteroidetes bacterium]|nr:DUF4338 domain-containing protein [Bacteroidota bacterium]
MIGLWEVASTWDPRFLAALRVHYSGSAGPPPGKKAVWQVLDGGRHRGWVGLGEPAYKLAPRRRLGLNDARPLPRTVSVFVFRLDPGPSLASAVLRAWHPVATSAWSQRYGWEPEHWETMVDPDAVASPVPGACFRRAGYRSLGLTTGRSARRPPGSTHGPRVWADAAPKLVLYRGPLPRIEVSE